MSFIFGLIEAMWFCSISPLFFSILMVGRCCCISSPISPFIAYKHSAELEANVADLWWTVDEAAEDITFELHVKTTGWIALGISPAGGMNGADIGVGWVDQMGKLHFQDRHATGRVRPIVDNTTTDWFGLQGREQNGWTAIRFRRLLDTCDPMDVPIKSGTNVIIFAFGLGDPDPDIHYHENRRGTRMIPLRSYADPPLDSKFADFESFELRLNDYVVPSADTTYHCKVYKAPTNFPLKRHAVAHKILIEPSNHDLVHHMLLYECDPSAYFDDANLPDGMCDDITAQISLCLSNVATAWAIGGNEVIEYPDEAGYPIGGDFVIKYYMTQIHYENTKLVAGRRDSTGIRFYIGKQLRQHDIGYLSFGTDATAYGLVIPSGVDRFIVDSYCPANASHNFPESGITVFSAFPHTHLQGHSLWTKLIRNKVAVQYLFNGEAYDFNYQFDNRLSKPIQLYQGDEFATRCVYSTRNKNETTLGGKRTKDEMCFHGFTYYPRMKDLYTCFTYNEPSTWQTILNTTAENVNYNKLTQMLMDIKWTPKLAATWQDFYDNAARIAKYGRTLHFQTVSLATVPVYEDLEDAQCSLARREKAFTGCLLISLMIRKIFLI